MTDRLELLACPLCGSEDGAFLLDVRDEVSGESFIVDRCQRCTGAYLRDPPSPERIGAYYANQQGDLMHEQPNVVFRALQGVALSRDVAPLLEAVPRTKPIVDLGAGDGRLSRFMARGGRWVEARDMMPPAEWPHSGVVPYRQVDLNGGALTREDVLCDGHVPGGVVLRHVLEHLYRPREVLRLLAGVGVQHVLVIVPNLDARLAGLLGPWWSYWDPPRHLHCFNPRSLERLATDAGYTAVQQRTYGIDEVVSSFHRWAVLRGRDVGGPLGSGLASLGRLLHAKSPPAALSSALVSSVGSNVLWCLFELAAKPPPRRGSGRPLPVVQR